MTVEKYIMVACLTLFIATGVMGGEFNVLGKNVSGLDIEKPLGWKKETMIIDQ